MNPEILTEVLHYSIDFQGQFDGLLRTRDKNSRLHSANIESIQTEYEAFVEHHRAIWLSTRELMVKIVDDLKSRTDDPETKALIDFVFAKVLNAEL